MQEVYRLLRNNKESGPYLRDELIHQDIQPFDLVWVEGKSANWSHPAEIDSLQSYLGSLPGSPNSNYQQKVDNEELVQEKVSTEQPPAHYVNEGFVHVSYPTNRLNDADVSGSDIIDKETMTADLNPSQKLDLKAEELFKRTQAYSASSNHEIRKNDTDLPRYTKSLDDLKEEYVTWRYAKKREKKKIKPLHAAAVLIILIGLFSLLLFNPAKNTNSASTGESVNKTILIGDNASHDENISSQSSQKVEVIPSTNNSEFKSEIQYGIDEIPPGDQQVLNNPAISQSKGKKVANDNVGSGHAASVNVPAIIPIQGKNVVETNAKFSDNYAANDRITITKNSEDHNTSIVHNQKPLIQNRNTSNSPNPVQNKSALPLSQVFSIYGVHPAPIASRTQGVDAFKITIKNNSDQLRFAAVDVFYKTKNGEVIKKETIYFKEVPPHQSMTLVAPSNNLADDVTYRLGLVSSDNGSIYYAQQ